MLLFLQVERRRLAVEDSAVIGNQLLSSIIKTKKEGMS